MIGYEQPLIDYRGYVKIIPGRRFPSIYSEIDDSEGILSGTELDIKGIPKECFPAIVGTCINNLTGGKNFIATSFERENLLNKIRGRAGNNKFVVPASKVSSKFIVDLKPENCVNPQ